jgi:deazaflavin-dependent oxidoreductase (nitroreductase family)
MVAHESADDPYGFEGSPDLSPLVDPLDWLTWTDAARELGEDRTHLGADSRRDDIMTLTTLKRRMATTFSGYLVNPVVKLIAGRMRRTSGKPRHTPVGDGLQGDTFWIVAEHGRHSDYVRNIMANPHVRVRVGGTWRRGTAHVMPSDDARARQRTLDPLNAAIVRLVGTELLTVRIDLQREGR